MWHRSFDSYLYQQIDTTCLPLFWASTTGNKTTTSTAARSGITDRRTIWNNTLKTESTGTLITISWINITITKRTITTTRRITTRTWASIIIGISLTISYSIIKPFFNNWTTFTSSWLVFCIVLWYSRRKCSFIYTFEDNDSLSYHKENTWFFFRVNVTQITTLVLQNHDFKFKSMVDYRRMCSTKCVTPLHK